LAFTLNGVLARLNLLLRDHDCWTLAGLSAANEVFERKWERPTANKTRENRWARTGQV